MEEERPRKGGYQTKTYHMQKVCAVVIEVTHLEPNLRQGYCSSNCCKNYLVIFLTDFSFREMAFPSADSAQILLQGVHTPYGRNHVDHLVDMSILPEQDRIFIEATLRFTTNLKATTSLIESPITRLIRTIDIRTTNTRKINFVNQVTSLRFPNSTAPRSIITILMKLSPTLSNGDLARRM